MPSAQGAPEVKRLSLLDCRLFHLSSEMQLAACYPFPGPSRLLVTSTGHHDRGTLHRVPGSSRAAGCSVCKQSSTFNRMPAQEGEIPAKITDWK